MTQAYLYKWSEKSTNKWYIGSRTAKNCRPNDGYICSSQIVKPLIKSNPDNWTRQILCIGNPSYIRELESLYLIKLDAKNNIMSYNLSNGGPPRFSVAGLPSPNKGKKASEETRIKQRNSHLGKIQTSETIEKRRAKHIGKKLSDETKAKIGAANRGKVSHNKGKKFSDETKAKIGAANRGKKRTPEQRKHLSIINTGRIPWNKGKILYELHGKTCSEETKAKISAAKKGKKPKTSICTHCSREISLSCLSRHQKSCKGLNHEL